MRNIFARRAAPPKSGDAAAMTVEVLRQDGFEGFVTVGHLRESECADVPESPGVYLMLMPDDAAPRFLPASPAARARGEDSTVSIAELEENWVPDALVLYVGKAGGRGSTATLKQRIGKYLDFGRGRQAGHRAGRYVWQLARSGALVMCWKPTDDAAVFSTEAAVLETFQARHDTAPFAN